MRKFLIALLFLSLPVMADVPTPDFGYVYNNLAGIPAASKWQFGNKLREMHNTAVCVYDYATLGGAVGNISLVATDLKTPCRLPGKGLIRNGVIDITTTFTGGAGSQASFSSGKTTADLKASVAMASLTAGQYITVPVFATVGTYIKLTSANSIVNGVSLNAYQPYITVATAALTAGHARVFIDYVVSE